MNTWVRAVLSCSLLFATLLFLQLRSYGEAVPIHRPLSQFPQTVGLWHGKADATLDPSVLGLLKLNDYLLRHYRNAQGHDIWLYVGFWDTQRKGAQIHSPKHCLPGGGWQPLDSSLVPLTFGNQRQEIVINRYVLQKDNLRQVVSYWYQSRGQVVAREIDAKFQLIRNAIIYNRTDGALIRLTSPVITTVEDASARQIEYLRELWPLLGEFLPQ